MSTKNGNACVALGVTHGDPRGDRDPCNAGRRDRFQRDATTDTRWRASARRRRRVVWKCATLCFVPTPQRGERFCRPFPCREPPTSLEPVSRERTQPGHVRVHCRSNTVVLPYCHRDCLRHVRHYEPDARQSIPARRANNLREDIIKQIEKQYGLDKPLPVRFVSTSARRRAATLANPILVVRRK